MPPIKKRAAAKKPAKKVIAPRKKAGSKLLVETANPEDKLKTEGRKKIRVAYPHVTAPEGIPSQVLLDLASVAPEDRPAILDKVKEERLRSAYGGMFDATPPPVPVLKSSAYIGMQLIDFHTLYDHDRKEYHETLVLINDAAICYIRYENIKPFTRAFRETIEEFRR